MYKKFITILSIVLILAILLPSAALADVNAAHSLGSRKLSEGMEGTDVVSLQTTLKAKGFYSGEASGRFTEETEAAVYAYQSASKILYPYGVADFATLNFLANDDFLSATSLGGRRLSTGMSGEDVRDLESRLIKLGFLSGVADTAFGTATASAVKAYQESAGLYPYGVADFTTIRHLLNDTRLKVSMLIPGNIQDGGFMQAGYNGIVKIGRELGAETDYIDNKKPELEELATALRELAKDAPDMIIAHGGQCSAATKLVAAENPDIKFVVVQGSVTGDNLSSYEVLQEESAWLAGAAAGLLTETNVVGHISGIRVRPGLKGRAAFSHGLAYTNPDATYLTNFCGYQDDNEISRAVAEAEIAEGADIIFTMLNAGRQGATDAMKEAGVYHIGNVVDWTKVDPDVFIASAVANVSMGSFNAARDLQDGTWEAGTINKIGLENPDAVNVPLNPAFVPQEVMDKLEELAEMIENGEIVVSTEYDGPEFEVDIP